MNSKAFAAERKLFGFTSFMNDKRTAYMYEQREKQKRNDFIFALLSSTVEVSGYIATIVIMLLMFPGLMQKTISIGFFISFARAALTLNNAMQYQVKNRLDILAQHRLFWKEYWTAAGIKGQSEESYGSSGTKCGSSSCGEPFHTLEFCDVSFSYPNGTAVLEHVSFQLKAGKHYALVGENGSGKSTIVKLILGLYSPTSRKILLNGRDISQISAGVLSDCFSVVFQDFSRYAVSLEENISLGRPVKKDLLDGILRRVGLDGVVAGLPEGIRTHLGKIEKDGVDLSGGEWQKAAIARAMYQNGEFMILDEPTASMDPIAESRMYAQYDQLMQGKGTLFISHRLASATLADQILVLKDKKIWETGTHQELMARKGHYFTMFSAQRKWYWKGGEA